MATTAITRSISSTSTINKYTLSMWIKRGVVSANYPRLFTANGGTGDVYLRFNNDDTLEWSGDASNASSAGYAITNRRFRDPSAWYHIVIRFDSTQGSASARLRIYVNGTQEESFSTYTDINQNATDKIVDTSKVHRIGGNAGSADSFFDGSITHFHFTQGYSYSPTEFGEVDSTSGIWKAKTSPSVTYGTNGFFLKMENSGAMGTDSSGESNTFTTSGTLTQNVDTPDNNFATWNGSIGNMDTLTNGNTTVARSASSWRSAFSSLPLPSTGKYYCEFKISTGTNCRIGIADDNFDNCVDVQNRGLAGEMGSTANSIAYINNGNYQQNPGTYGSWGASFTSSNVIGMAVDMTNMKLYFSKDGVYQNSGDPTSGATGTGAFSITATTGKYFAGVSINASGCHVNFGNGTFGTTAITSAGTPGSTPGKFEYDVPTGYEPLTTKGLNV